MDKISNLLTNNGCQLITTKEDYQKQCWKNKTVTFIAQCGHQNTVRVSNLTSKLSGITCKDCINDKIASTLRRKAKENGNESSKMGDSAVKLIVSTLSMCFNAMQTPEGCVSSIVFSHNGQWYGLHVKAISSASQGLYKFSMRRKYPSMLVLFFCVSEQKLWLMKGDDIAMLRFSFGKQSKYNKHMVELSKLNAAVEQHIQYVNPISLDLLLTPITKNRKVERAYAQLRESKLAGIIQFSSPEQQKTSTDFIIGDLRVQEKVSTCIKPDVYKVILHKKKMGKQTTYDVGDNDLYWIHIPDKDMFYVFPEAVLIKQGQGHVHVSIVTSAKQCFTIYLGKNEWYQEYKYCYTAADITKLVKLIEELLIKHVKVQHLVKSLPDMFANCCLDTQAPRQPYNTNIEDKPLDPIGCMIEDMKPLTQEPIINTTKVSGTIKPKCMHCGSMVSKANNRCQQCYNFAMRRVERPSYAQLLIDKQTMSMLAIGKKYNVSDNAVRKWIRGYTNDSQV